MAVATAGTPGRTHIPLPPAYEICQRLGGRRMGHISGQPSYRLPHFCDGESMMGDNPGLVAWTQGGRTRVYCHYGCEPKDAEKAVRAALGDYSSDEPRPYFARTPADETPRPRPRRPFVEPKYHAPAGYELIPDTGWPLLQGDGTYSDRLDDIQDVWTAWCSYELADGRSRKILRQFPPQRGVPKCKWDGDVGRPLRGLTPFLWKNPPAGAPLVIVEGEKAAAALVSSDAAVGVASVSSTSGFKNANYRPVVEGQHVIIWPDADDPVLRQGNLIREGLDAAKAAVPLIQMAGALSVSLVDIELVRSMVPDVSKRDGADAADLASAAIREVLTKIPDFGPNQRANIEEGPADRPEIRVFMGVSFDHTLIDSEGREPEPPRPPSFWCLNPTWLRTAMASTGDEVEQYLKCGVCAKCIYWYKVLKTRRYSRGVDDETEQTVASLRLPTLTDAIRFRKLLNNMDDAPRVSLVQPDGTAGGWKVTVVFADLSEKRARAFAKRHGATVERGPVTPDDFIAMLPEKKRFDEDGVTCAAAAFAGGWRAPGYRRGKPRYLTNQGTMVNIAGQEFKNPPEPFVCENEEIKRLASMDNEEEAAYLSAVNWMATADMSRISDFWTVWAERLAGKEWVRQARKLHPVIKYNVSESLLRDAARCWLGMIPLREAFVPVYEQIASPWPPPLSEQPVIRKSTRDTAAGGGAVNVKGIRTMKEELYQVVTMGAEEQPAHDSAPYYAQDHGTPLSESDSLEPQTTLAPPGNHVYSRLACNEPGYWDGVDEELEEVDLLGRPRIQWTGLEIHVPWPGFGSTVGSPAWQIQQKLSPIFERSQETRPSQYGVTFDKEGLEPDWFGCQCEEDRWRERSAAKSTDPAAGVVFCQCDF